MQLNVYAIKDRATNAFMTPFFMHTHGQAIRAFTDNINDPKSTASQHPDDYDLWHLDEWDDANGEFKGCEAKQICIGKNVVVLDPHASYKEKLRFHPD